MAWVLTSAGVLCFLAAALFCTALWHLTRAVHPAVGAMELAAKWTFKSGWIWLPLLLIASIGTPWLWRWINGADDPRLCTECGYNLTGLPIGTCCPECGHSPPPLAQLPQHPP